MNTGNTLISGKSKTQIKIGIYAMGILMMGIVGVSGALTVIGARFPEASQSMIQSIISIPCLAVLPATIITGKLMGSMAKKTLGIIGIALFLIGGLVPAVLTSLPLILVFRAMFGVGVGIIQSAATALVAEHFEGTERESVQGTLTSAQMLGCACMVFAGGWLGGMTWNASFFVHAIAILTLVIVVICLPGGAPGAKAGQAGMKTDTSVQVIAQRKKTTLTRSSWSWAGITFLMFIGVQIYTVYISYLLEEKALGGAAQSGATVAVACIGGFIMGLLYSRLAGRSRNLTFAAGLFVMALGYVIIALAGNLMMIYIGGLIYGFSMSICMPAAFLNTAASVDEFSSAMALSITMCAQNLGQFVSPYVFNFITAAMGSTIPNTMTYVLAAILLAGMGIPAAVWGIRKNALSTVA